MQQKIAAKDYGELREADAILSALPTPRSKQRLQSSSLSRTVPVRFLFSMLPSRVHS